MEKFIYIRAKGGDWVYINVKYISLIRSIYDSKEENTEITLNLSQGNMIIVTCVSVRDIIADIKKMNGD